MAATLYLDDFVVGQRFAHGLADPVTAEAIKAYAREFDPQPFHLDEAAAAQTFFKGLAASGWHTVSMTMRLLVDTLPIAGGIIGAGFDELRFPRPVRPGDRLRIEVEILEIKPSKSRPEQGFVRHRVTTFNQNDEPVLILAGNVLATRRP